MQYGCFDQVNREYVITRPDTPQPWSNYIGSTEYGGVVANHAAGRDHRRLFLPAYVTQMVSAEVFPPRIARGSGLAAGSGRVVCCST